MHLPEEASEGLSHYLLFLRITTKKTPARNTAFAHSLEGIPVVLLIYIHSEQYLFAVLFVKLTRIGSVEVAAHGPRPRDSAVGLIRDIDCGITDSEIKDK